MTKTLSPQKPEKKPCLKLNRLDLAILFAVSIAGIWIYHRSEVGIEYIWRWKEAVILIFTPRADGSIPYFFQGVIATLRLSLWGVFLALPVGVLVGLSRHSSIYLLRSIANMYILLIRNIPPLVFVFIFYFFISNQLIPGLGLDSVLRDGSETTQIWQIWLFGPKPLWENLLSGVLCISILSSAYIAEIVRSGLANIPRGQWEAADALGLSMWAKYRFVIAPQVLITITPALAGQAISLVKDTSIVSLISIQEMTFVGTEMANSSGLIFEIWLIVGAVYLIFCATFSALFKRLEKKSLKFQNSR
ncbi:amino acid ABC transporter permease [Vibrio sp. Of14-4]|uniref:amino acid ABC transporter permease n=1 Tax=Vibrio sp. Of14-4 TaxID=2724878 RepID=UPI001EF2AFA8|nr:amino acid ABC transporter permease [Vibrio sp. Of14-4]